MKVLNLQCGNEHRFEGWFDSESDFLSQQAGGRVQCPVCSDTQVMRLPSAPRLNVSNLREAPPTSPPADAKAEMQAQWLRAVREVLARTEDVGERFVEEARRIHYGETEERQIRGQASAEDAQALREEGIGVVAIELPAELMKQTLQ